MEEWMYTQFKVFLILVPVAGKWSVSRSGCFNPGERAPATHWIEDWMGPRADLDDMEN
jgi:hypothetical protein